MLTEIDEVTGSPMAAAHFFEFARGGMPWLAIWPHDFLMWESPTIPRQVREMSINAVESLLNDPNTIWVHQDNRIRALDVEEANEMAINIDDDWVAFLTDTSDTPDEVLWEQFRARWLANGYEAAKEAMTRAAAEAGITR
jgi:hypothetical protein